MQICFYGFEKIREITSGELILGGFLVIWNSCVVLLPAKRQRFTLPSQMLPACSALRKKLCKRIET